MHEHNNEGHGHYAGHGNRSGHDHHAGPPGYSGHLGEKWHAKSGMDVLECIKTRRSIHKYLSVEVELEKLGDILHAAQMAPSSGNLQNWKFVVLMEAPLRKQVAEICLEQHWMEQAPIHIVVVSDPERVRRFYGIRGERLYSIQNCAAAMENMLLAAHAVGLGANWVSAFDEDKRAALIGLPAPWRVQGVITIGYADEQPEEPQRYNLEHMVYYNTFSNRIQDLSQVLGETSHYLRHAIDKGINFLGKLRRK